MNYDIPAKAAPATSIQSRLLTPSESSQRHVSEYFDQHTTEDARNRKLVGEYYDADAFVALGLVDMVNILAAHGAEIEARDRIGRTPLLVSCEYGHSNIFELLVSRFGADVDATDSLQRTAFHLACCCRSAKLPNLILKLREHLREATDRHGRTGLFYAVLNTDEEAAKDITEMILRSRAADGLTAYCVDSYGKSPLEYAKERSRSSIVDLLLRYRASHTIKTPDTFESNLSSQQTKYEALWPTGDSRCLSYAEFSTSWACVELSLTAWWFWAGHKHREKLVKLARLMQRNALDHMFHVKLPDIFNGSWIEEDSKPITVLSEEGSTGNGGRNSIRCLQCERFRAQEKERDGKMKELARQIELADQRLRTVVSATDYAMLQEEEANLRASKTQLEIQMMESHRQSSFTAEKIRSLTEELERRSREGSELSVRLAAAQRMIDSMAVEAAKKDHFREGYERLKQKVDVLEREKGLMIREKETLENKVQHLSSNEVTTKLMGKLEYENRILQRRIDELEAGYRSASDTHIVSPRNLGAVPHAELNTSGDDPGDRNATRGADHESSVNAAIGEQNMVKACLSYEVY
ncbi:hypothetical protein FOL47_009185 [Perkinsus chesapeaki]|uniref:Uncharacterized protein n=1 Tax=Perkinsus chesapeaki TaxID=330153 RepID=A0A7J6LA63_PERCH|nr:hypothetical protein FOL47_009185 [Perkinsus chesapeaki]